jgi:hypothetical protein
MPLRRLFSSLERKAEGYKTWAVSILAPPLSEPEIHQTVRGKHDDATIHGKEVPAHVSEIAMECNEVKGDGGKGTRLCQRAL